MFSSVRICSQAAGLSRPQTLETVCLGLRVKLNEVVGNPFHYQHEQLCFVKMVALLISPENLFPKILPVWPNLLSWEMPGEYQKECLNSASVEFCLHFENQAVHPKVQCIHELLIATV